MFILSLIACGKGFSVSETAPLGNIQVSAFLRYLTVKDGKRAGTNGTV